MQSYVIVCIVIYSGNRSVNLVELARVVTEKSEVLQVYQVILERLGGASYRGVRGPTRRVVVGGLGLVPDCVVNALHPQHPLTRHCTMTLSFVCCIIGHSFRIPHHSHHRAVRMAQQCHCTCWVVHAGKASAVGSAEAVRMF